jgi:hypothetical protein
MTIPMSSDLLIHPQGRVLFDTGVHCQAITDPSGHEFFPRATFLVQSREVARARGPDNPYDPQEVDHPLDYHLVDGDHDIFGDGTLVLITTYGHTPGHQSLWVRDGQATQLCSEATPVTPRNIWTGVCCCKRSGMPRPCRTP